METGRKRIGELLVEWGLVSRAQLAEALKLQEADGRRLGVILVERGIVHATKLTQVLSHQFSLPFANLERVKYTPELVATLPATIAQERRLVPICTSGDEVLFAATDDPGDEDLAEAASRACGREVRLMVASPAQVQAVLDSFYASPTPERPQTPPVSRQPVVSLRCPEPVGAVRLAVSEHPPPDLNGAACAVTIEPPEPPDAEIIELDEADLVSATEPPKPRIPTVLVVRGTERLVALCKRATAAQGIELAQADLVDATELATTLRPIALVLMESVFALDRIGFTKLSIQVGAHLVIWSDSLEGEYLEPLLAAARDHAPNVS